MRRVIGALAVWTMLGATGCTGGAAGDPADDIGDVFVLTHSPGNGDQVDVESALDGFNALNNPTLTNPGAVTIVFTNSLDPASVLNPDPADPQGTRNVRLFYFDPSQGPFDDTIAVTPGVNPPGANVLVQATTVLTSTRLPNDTLIIRPVAFNNTPFGPSHPLPPGQYTVIVEVGVRGADGDGMRGAEYFFFFRVGQDTLGPVVVSSTPAPGERDVDPATEIRISLSETALGSTVNRSTLMVSYQPSGALLPISIPGDWFVDGGNGPGNNFPAVQLDANGNPGGTGVSARNGSDLVFRPDLTAFPVNLTAEDPLDFACTLRTNPPRKGNRGFPLGQAITVSFVTAGIGVTDTAGNPIRAGSPNTTFTFETKAQADPVFAPRTRDAIYFADTIGVGVIDIRSGAGYFPGPNPGRTPNTVVTAGTGPAQSVVRVPVPDLVDMQLDTRPYTAFHTMVCTVPFPPPSLFMANLYVASGSQGGGEVLVVDTYRMIPLGRFGTPSPGGVALTAFGTAGRLCVSNFSANTVTVFDVGDVDWYTGPNFLRTTGQLFAATGPGGSETLLLNEDDFATRFQSQRPDLTSPPGPPVIGTIKTGISPGRLTVTGLNGSMGVPPILTNDPIICVLATGESTADFTHFTNLAQSTAIDPDLPGIAISSAGVDVAWATWSGTAVSYYFLISAVGGTVELFASGNLAGSPSVRGGSSALFAPNQIISNLSGFENPTDVQWFPLGVGVLLEPFVSPYRASFGVAETGADRIQQLSITAEIPSILFQVTNANHASGLGPIGIAGDPASVAFPSQASPTFTSYYVANAGGGTVTTGDYRGGVVTTTIPVGGVIRIASWWTR